MGKNVQ